jgi:type I restriction enzyme R subunit
MKEATARIKINKLLEAAGWRFLPENGKPANIQLEPGVKLNQTDLDALGNDFETVTKGYIDFLLLDDRGFPHIVLEAKSEKVDPLSAKEQARKYAKSINCRYVILSNGNIHYFWDLERGNPYVLTAFPTPESIQGFSKVKPNPEKLIEEDVRDDYVALTQRPNYANDAGWKNPTERHQYIIANKLRFLRPYQLKSILAIQAAVKKGNDRFLLEMATGTGKTLTSAAIIKLFLRTGNARRVLFLVDRIELEQQANKAFSEVLSADYKSVIYKESRDDWRHAEIVVTTVQSLLFNNKYQQHFSPTDFDLVISDEAHRSIGGNARAVFDYFVGYKLGLTATPKDYLKRFDKQEAMANDPREYERRMLLDTYKTFGCEDSAPTFRYSLLDGVRDGYLINPTVIDARTEITTELLSKKGYVVKISDGEGQDAEETYKQRDFEKKFFSVETNVLMCKTFLENAYRDPISGEIGKSLVFAVTQHHASKLTQILNEIADVMFPGRYQSDFAVQVTSIVPDAQNFTTRFTNNNLMGSENFLEAYKTSKARVCVTVGMMTTGYDCPDLLNLGLFRPIFSPSDFIQIKGRGTRKHEFLQQMMEPAKKDELGSVPKESYKLFDFFANCEYFEKEFKYDQIIELPKPKSNTGTDPVDPPHPPSGGTYQYLGADTISQIKEEVIGTDGMKIDRMFFESFEDVVKEDPTIAAAVEAGQWDVVIDYVNREVFDKPNEYYTLDKLRKATGVDRRLSLREILEKVFGLIPRFKSKDELLEEEFAKFVANHVPDPPSSIPAIKHYFKAYITDGAVRNHIDLGEYGYLNTNPKFSMRDLKAVPEVYRHLVPEYVKDYVSLNQFAQ